jgi:hypothetical protein
MPPRDFSRRPATRSTERRHRRNSSAIAELQFRVTVDFKSPLRPPTAGCGTFPSAIGSGPRPYPEISANPVGNNTPSHLDHFNREFALISHLGPSPCAPRKVRPIPLALAHDIVERTGAFVTSSSVHFEGRTLNRERRHINEHKHNFHPELLSSQRFTRLINTSILRRLPFPSEEYTIRRECLRKTLQEFSRDEVSWATL